MEEENDPQETWDEPVKGIYQFVGFHLLSVKNWIEMTIPYVE